MRHRQGQRHHQLPSGDGAHRQIRRRAVLDHRQPNAMGGRETGGLANMLAAHMDIENAAHRGIVQRFWNSPVIAFRSGLKAVDIFQAVADGRIKAIWVMATNPVDSMPDADAVGAALAGPASSSSCPISTPPPDILPYAHVKLPSAGWGEKDGMVTNSERRISRQRASTPIGGSLPRLAAVSAMPQRSVIPARRDLPRICGADRLREWRYPRPRRPCWDRQGGLRRPQPISMARSPGRRPSRDPLFRRRRLLHSRPPGGLHSRHRHSSAEHERGVANDAEYRPHPTSGTP
jgi:anaerobic selenocysteine-containing dehydrogenase